MSVDFRHISRILVLIGPLSVSGCLLTQERWDVGTVDGAQFRMKMPVSWNRTLVLAAGGYSRSLVTFRPDQSAGPFAEELVRQGYAYAETGYSSGGLAIAEAIADLRALRRYFIGKYGQPQRTFLIGESKGGLVALVLVESSPSEFDGVMTISGLLSSPYAFFRRAFDLLVLYHYHFPSVLPPPAQVPHTYAADEQMVGRVLTSLKSNSRRAAIIREHASVRSDEELAELLAFHTEALADLQRRCGGNPFDNRDTRYSVGPDAVAAGPGVPRYVADPTAERCARSLPAPTGTLQRPLLAVDTEYDPIIPSWSANEYVVLLERAGRQHLFVRRVVRGEGHLDVTTADQLLAFSSLVRWSAGEIRPPDGIR